MKKAQSKSWDLLAVIPSPTARHLLWHVFSLDTHCLDEAEHHEPHEKPGAHLFWILSGHGTLETDGNRYLLERGKAVWMVDMMKERTYAPSAGQKLVKRGIRFGHPALENWQKAFGGSKQAQFDLADVSLLHKAFRNAWRICQRKAQGWEWQVHLILEHMLHTMLVSRNLLSSTPPELPVAVTRVLNAIASNPFHDWQVKELAHVSGVSYSGLRTLFFEVLHENLHEFVQRHRLEQAQLLLSDPALSSKQIAEQMNFSSEFYFSHFFKKLRGVSPREYRQRQMNKR